MKWKMPPKIKIYEALGCIGDKRIEIKDNQAKVYSSSRKKYYTVKYDDKNKAIVANDNGSYWQGYLGYPAIAILLQINKIKFNDSCSQALRNIAWKELNKKFKNDYSKTEIYIKERVASRGGNTDELEQEIKKISQQIKHLDLDVLYPKIKPPPGQ
jgi:hypothetical protein